MSLNSTPARQSIPPLDLDLTARRASSPTLSGSQSLRSSSQNVNSSLSGSQTLRSSPTSISSTSSLRSSPIKNFKNIFKSSPKKEIISPPPTPKSPNSLESSPTRSQVRCHQCRQPLIIDATKELFLAIKCTCLEVPCYFCTRECHRAHWITMNTRTNTCLFYDFKEHLANNTSEFPLAAKLEWTNIEYIHNLYHYKECFLII